MKITNEIKSIKAFATAVYGNICLLNCNLRYEAVGINASIQIGIFTVKNIGDKSISTSDSSGITMPSADTREKILLINTENTVTESIKNRLRSSSLKNPLELPESENESNVTIAISNTAVRV